METKDKATASFSPKDQIKLVLLGDSGVGKTSILTRYVAENYKENIENTVGALFMSKIVQRKSRIIKFMIWDTAGQERFRSLAQTYYHNAEVALLVYDITNPKSFEGIETWYQELQNHGPKSIQLVLIGNKADLDDLEEVDPETAKAYAKRIGAMYGKTSAKTNYGIESIFNKIAEKCEDMW